LRLLGAVEPHTEPIDELQAVTVTGAPTGGSFTLTFKGQTTAPLPFDAERDQVESALGALSTIGAGNVQIASEAGGSPWTVRFVGALGGVDQPQIEADGSGLTPAGGVAVSTVEDGFGYEANAFFQYVSQKQFAAPGAEGGWAKASATVPRSIGSVSEKVEGGFTFGVDVPGLTSGEAYRYRLVASNTTVGDPVVDGEEHTLTVPVALPASEAACPNEAFRTGPSVHLPDCRAYEQVTPTEKSGSMDTFNYNVGNSSGASASQDGDHVVVETGGGTKWGTYPDATNSSYFFSRQEGAGWSMVSTTPPGAGANSYRPEIFSADLARVGLSVGWSTGPGDASHDLEFEVGPPGGPYTKAATISRTPNQGAPEWVDGSADLGKLVLGTLDRTLLSGRSTGTVAGDDLYEYSAGQLRQLNVTSSDVTIGHCGAVMPQGISGAFASPRAISTDGSRVFFEAVPSADCSEAPHLYMRLDGGTPEARTVDIGAYRYLTANPDGSRLLLEKREAPGHQIVLYETESAEAKPLFAAVEEINSLTATENLSIIYFTSREALTPDATLPSPQSEFPPVALGEDLYRYEISGGLSFTGVQTGLDEDGLSDPSVSSDGRYLFFTAQVVGMFGGSPQAYRYDSVAGLLECVSCASPFDPTPREKAGSIFPGPTPQGSNSLPTPLYVSSDGTYAVFSTSSALLPADIDGEFDHCNPLDVCEGLEIGTHLFDENISTDIYEWRSDGTTGCARLDGCLALITSGTGGLRNQFLGIADRGRDIFFATHSQLVSTDTDSQGDVYDARIDGGFALPAAGLVECEGDACSTPVSAPIDTTPSSLAFAGPGNLFAPLESKPAVPKAEKKKKKKKKKPKRRGREKNKRAAVVRARTVVRRVGGSGR
jgi:hypothetical protein